MPCSWRLRDDASSSSVVVNAWLGYQPRSRSRLLADSTGVPSMQSALLAFNIRFNVPLSAENVCIMLGAKSPMMATTVLAVSNCVRHDGTSYTVLKHVEVEF